MCLTVCGDLIRKRTVVLEAGRVGRFLCSRNLSNNESRAISSGALPDGEIQIFEQRPDPETPAETGQFVRFQRQFVPRDKR